VEKYIKYVEEFFKLIDKYNVKIREFEVELGKSKIICRDVIPKEEVIEKVKKYEVTLYLYPEYFTIQGLTIYSSQDFLLKNFDKIMSILKIVKDRIVFFYGDNLYLLEFLIKHTVDKGLRIIVKDNWVVVNNLIYNLSCGENGLLSFLMYLHEIYRPIIVGNCSLLNFASYFINRGIVAFLEDHVFINGNVISPPDVNVINYVATKPLKNRYEIINPQIDVISKIKELEDYYEGKRIVISGSSISIF